jgi:hypothetical protein
MLSSALLACLILFALLNGTILFHIDLRKVGQIGLPYTAGLVNEFEVWSYITDLILRWKYATYLMKGQGCLSWACFMVKDWMHEGKARAHREFGEVFLVVSLAGIICYFASARTANNLSTRRKDFVKSGEKLSIVSCLLYFHAIFLMHNRDFRTNRCKHSFDRRRSLALSSSNYGDAVG